MPACSPGGSHHLLVHIFISQGTDLRPPDVTLERLGCHLPHLALLHAGAAASKLGVGVGWAASGCFISVDVIFL